MPDCPCEGDVTCAYKQGIASARILTLRHLSHPKTADFAAYCFAEFSLLHNCFPFKIRGEISISVIVRDQLDDCLATMALKHDRAKNEEGFEAGDTQVNDFLKQYRIIKAQLEAHL